MTKTFPRDHLADLRESPISVLTVRDTHESANFYPFSLYHSKEFITLEELSIIADSARYRDCKGYTQSVHHRTYREIVFEETTELIELLLCMSKLRRIKYKVLSL